jgi:putative salt-induced outer membrane protein
MSFPTLMTAFLLVLANVASAADVAPRPGYHNETEAGLILTGGNTRSESLSLKTDASYRWSEDRAQVLARYLRAEASDLESARNWGLTARYERTLSPRFSLFVAQSVEADPFAGFMQRYSTDLGPKYSILKEEGLSWDVEGGYRFTHENRLASGGATQTLNSHYARVYTQVEKAFSTNGALKYSLEYLPNFTRSENYQINTELSVAAVLTSLLSLKTSYLVRFNNFPPAGIANKTDTTLTAAFVAKIGTGS